MPGHRDDFGLLSVEHLQVRFFVRHPIRKTFLKPANKSREPMTLLRRELLRLVIAKSCHLLRHFRIEALEGDHAGRVLFSHRDFFAPPKHRGSASKWPLVMRAGPS